MNYVIIGNSVCGIATVEGIRKFDKKGKITLIGNEKYKAYSRPLISYLIEGKTDLNKINYRSDDFYEENKVHTVFGKKAVKIDKDEKKVVLDNGKEIFFDKLMVATGSKPFIPPITGYETVKNKTSFMTIDDAKYLMEHIDINKNVLIMGAGLIGLKCAECLSGKVKSISVVDLADRVLPSILKKEEAKSVQDVLEEKGIKFYLENSVASFEKNVAFLKDEQVLPFDILVTAVGVRPNVELVKEIGGVVNRGIVINDKCETSLKDIYAGGDCAETFDISFGDKRVLAILPNAYLEGETAGENMAGGNKAFDNAIPMNSIGFFGFHIISAGTYEGEKIAIDEDENKRIFYVKDDLLKGYMLIGKVDKAGIYTSLIRNKTKLSTIDFNAIIKEPSLICFDKKKRDEILTN